jgi:hypothetical protein
MPVKVDAKDRKLLLAAGGVFVLLIGVAVVFSGDGGTNAGVPSSYSTASGGAKAAYLVLASAGYKVERWERPLHELPRAAGKTLVLAEPLEAPTHEEKDRLKEFLTEGGHVIATGMFAGTFLPENESVPEVFGGGTWKTASALSPSEITRAAPEIKLAPQARWTAYSAVYPLYGDGERTLVVKYPYGRGEVLWWASATPLTNAGLKESGNLEFLLACMGSAKDGAGKNGILWDEYIHGYRPTLASSIAHSPVKWLVLQLALLGLSVLATFSRRSGPIFKLAAVARLSPIEFVETLGGLYEHAGTASVAVDICYQRFRYWLMRRLGVASTISVAELEVAVRDRWAFIDQRFVTTLRRCESAKNDPYLHGPAALQLVQELDEYAVRLKLFQGIRKEKA